ncbi:MAG: hypothetical protein AAB425_02010, partial [Bdellovibrionota bacterium]
MMSSSPQHSVRRLAPLTSRNVNSNLSWALVSIQMAMMPLSMAATLFVPLRASAEPPGISSPELRRMQLARENFVLVDVRPPG